MKFETARRLNGVGEYYFSQKLRELDTLRKAGKPIINLGIGSPDGAPHPTVVAALNEAAHGVAAHGYQGYKGIPELRAAFAVWYQKNYGVLLNPDTEVLPLMGSKEGIMHLCMTYVNEGDAVLVPDPGYPTYRAAVTLAGGVPVEYQLSEKNDWAIDLDALALTVSNIRNSGQKLQLIFVNYPHMPTGAAGSKEFFEHLVAFARKHQLLICHDNPYSFILNDRPASLLSVAGAKDCVVELNSLSKSHNMAGWRVGVLCGAEERIIEVLRFKSNMDSGMFKPVQLATAAALSLGDDWYQTINEEYKRRRNVVFKMLHGLGCVYNPAQVGLFVWAKVPQHYPSGYALSDDLLYNHDVFITPGGIFGKKGDGYIRVSLCSAVVVLEEAVKRLKQKWVEA